MRPRFQSRGCAALLALALSCFTLAEAPRDAAAKPQAAPPRQLEDGKARAVAQRLLDALVETSGVPGLGAAVWRDGKVVWAGSAGWRDVDRRLPVAASTVFRLASVSKIIAVAAAARLREEGKLDVDAPIGAALPELPAHLRPITARQLAAHTAGLPHYQPVDEKRGSSHYGSVTAAVDIFKDRELLSPPGEAYRYSSWGYVLLSAAIERAAGVPYLEYLAKNLTVGLPIFPDVTDKSPRASRAYEFVDEKARPAAPHDFSYSWGGGGMSATPSAIAEFGGRLLRGKLVSPETFRWMYEPSKLADGRFVEDEDYQVGFGLRSSLDLDGNRLVHHGGVTLGARSALVLWPELRASASLLSNALWVSAIEPSARLLAAPFLPAPKSLPRVTCPVEAVRYEGQFGDQTIAGVARFSRQGGVCVGKLEVAAALAEYWNAFPQKNPSHIFVIGLASDGRELGRAALVTPAGLYELRASSSSAPLLGRFSPKRPLSLAFVADRSPLPPP